ncbi:RNA polymerase sigma factor [Syntrophomonas wolfei]|uniref:RNA polymerase, sigma-24 subunit, ECF subfamily n=1 Tax=Syntrophomonas wolfei subsp. wolfei (strain DSM 2245B / Goettingen) TaxID=335541 RepID=Q0ATZ3_SYNWW|nr:sigma-70 family RNA polymerase sigma factor [Syntrophomonas wolfei]ABI69811.1 RNA polymerase, sigma-24 subunit, ECF subfamily [Syntrophomonas wolfei subsp. wolfei str. Goettingen G311]
MTTTTGNCALNSMVQALAAGDDRAWQELMQTPWYSYALWKMEFNFGNDGEDLMQEALTDLYLALNRYLNSGNSITSLKALFLKIVNRNKNTYLDKYYRRSGIVTQISYEAESMENYQLLNEPDDYEQLEDKLLLSSYIPALQEAVLAAKIKPEEWDIIIAYYAYNESDRSIAVRLKKPINTIKSKRQRAMARLQKKCKESRGKSIC